MKHFRTSFFVLMLFGTATLASAQDNVAQGLDISAERERIKADALFMPV